MSYFLGFKFRVILNIYWIPFDAVVVFSLEHDFLFKSESTYCGTDAFAKSKTNNETCAHIRESKRSDKNYDIYTLTCR